MKTLTLLMIFFFVNAVFAESPVTVCKDVQLMSKDEQGKVTLQPTGASYEVFKSKKGKYGLAAEITNREGRFTELDVLVEFEELHSIDSAFEMYETLNQLRDEPVDQSLIKNLRMTNIGVEANQEDGGGTMIIEYMGHDDRPLLKGAMVGMAYAVCQ